MPRIVVVGAGIGGLCAARAAALAGHDPVVIERSPAGTALGAGLVLWPNAVHALDALGHGPAVRAVAAVARRAVFLGASGGKLSEIDLEAVGRSEGARGGAEGSASLVGSPPAGSDAAPCRANLLGGTA